MHQVDNVLWQLADILELGAETEWTGHVIRWRIGECDGEEQSVEQIWIPTGICRGSGSENRKREEIVAILWGSVVARRVVDGH